MCARMFITITLSFKGTILTRVLRNNVACVVDAKRSGEGGGAFERKTIMLLTLFVIFSLKFPPPPTTFFVCHAGCIAKYSSVTQAV